MGFIAVFKYLRARWIVAALVAVIFLGLGLRLYGINWDDGNGFHPDERSIYMQSDCMYQILATTENHRDCPRFIDYPETKPGFPGIDVFFDPDQSPLNPHWFPLGSILIYILVFIRSILGIFMDISTFDLRYVGRVLSALADVGSIFLIFLIGKRLFDPKIGLIAALFLCLAVVHVQSSHFYRPETFIVVVSLIAFWVMLNGIERRRLRDWISLGLIVGLLFAIKVSVLPILLPLILVFVLQLLTGENGHYRGISRSMCIKTSLHACIGAVFALGLFVLLTPYAVIDFQKFFADTTWEANNARIAGQMPYTIQYIGSTPFIYEFQQSMVWALGLPLGLAAWIGVLYTLIRSMLRKSGWKSDLLILCWVIPNLVIVSVIFEVKFSRYLFPLMPFLILYAARGLGDLCEFTRILSRNIRWVQLQNPFSRWSKEFLQYLGAGVLVVVILGTAFYTMAFMKVYSDPHTAIQASDWINSNWEPGSHILSDNHWDEFIPNLSDYMVEQIPIYDGENEGRIYDLADSLSKADYLVFYSNRTYGSISRQSERYPYRANYYKKLFSGDLGYKFEREFANYPEAFGITLKNDTFERAEVQIPAGFPATRKGLVALNMGWADENVTNYDHPLVLLFKNHDRKSRPAIFNSIMYDHSTSHETGLMLSDELFRSQQVGGVWSDTINKNGWVNTVPVLVWILLVELIYLAALPIAFLLFRYLPDRGIIFARVLGLLLISYVVWILASLQWVRFSQISLFVALASLLVSSGLILLWKKTELWGFIRARWRFIVFTEAFFLVAFFAFLALRVANPDLWHPWMGGEKPMDFSFLNAILLSSYMPPVDPWFSGGYINYYYFGLFVVASLIKVTGILPGVAYNLAIPLFFALTITCVFSIVYNVTAGIASLKNQRSRGLVGVDNENKGIIDSDVKGPVSAGILGAVFVGVIGNLDGFIQLVQSSWNYLLRARSFAPFDFWRSSRMLPELEDMERGVLTPWLQARTIFPEGTFCHSGLRVDLTCPDISPHITEFPFFSFLFGDLHAHVIVMPFALLSIALALVILVGVHQAPRRWLFIVSSFLGLTLGSLWTINTWDFPSYTVLSTLLIGMGIWLMSRTIDMKQKIILFLSVVGSMISISVLAFLPFHTHYETFGPVLRTSIWQTPLLDFLKMHGLFLTIIIPFLIFLNRRTLLNEILSFWWLSIRFLRMPVRKKRLNCNSKSNLIVWLGIVIVLVYLMIASYWTGALLTAIIALSVVSIWNLFCSKDESDRYRLFTLIVIAFAFLLALSVEFVRVGDDIGRMNTFFKFYLEIWIFLSISAAIALWYLMNFGWYSLKGITPRNKINLLILSLGLVFLSLVYVFWIGVRVDGNDIEGASNYLSLFYDVSVWGLIVTGIISVGFLCYLIRNCRPYLRGYLLHKSVWLCVIAILFMASFLYTVFGTRARLAARFDTVQTSLNGEKFMEYAIHTEKEETFPLKWDYEAIQWLRSHAKGSFVVLEGHTEQYRWGSRFSIYTGFPTIVGWPWHQFQQRADYQMETLKRISDVATIYNTKSVARAAALLQNYKVKYIVIGDLERIFYDKVGLKKFDQMEQADFLQKVFENHGTMIYEVIANDIDYP